MSSKLRISNCQTSDTGAYTAVVQNKVGKATIKCDVLVIYPPKILSELKSTNVVLKKPVVLETEVQSALPCEVQWFKNNEIFSLNNQALSEGRISFLERKGGVYQISIKNSKEDDAAEYSCLISNKVGSAKTNAKLEVWSPPIFLQKLDKIDAVENCETELTVELMGTPCPSITWLKNSETIDFTNTNKYDQKIQEKNFSLIIKSVSTSDAGSYQCVAVNPAGRASCLAKLTIYPLTAPKFTKVLDNLKLFAEDRPIELTVHVTGIPIPKVTWMKDGEIVNEDLENYEFIKDLSKGLRAIRTKLYGKKFEGTYKAVASNPGGEVITECFVKVEGYRPKFLDRPEKITCLEGETAILGCVVDGIPKPKIKWMLKNRDIIALKDPRYKTLYDSELNAYFLEIQKCSTSDKGTYQVIATNDHGSETAAVTLNMTDKPEEVTDFKSTLKSVTMNISKTDDGLPDWGSLRKTSGNKNLSIDDTVSYNLKHVEKESKNDDVEKDNENASTDKERKIRELKRREFSPIDEQNQKSREPESKTDSTLLQDNSALSKNIFSDSHEPFVSPLKDITIELGKNAIFECAVYSEKAFVTWFVNGKEVVQSQKYQIISLSKFRRLVINKCKKEENNSTITCSLDSVESKAILKILDNNVPISLKHSLKDRKIIEGEKLELACDIATEEPFETFWYRNNEAIQPKDGTIENLNDEKQVRLFIQSVTINDSGVYKVLIKTSTSSCFSECKIDVLQPAKIHQKLPETCNSKINDKFMFSVKVSGTPTPVIKWYFNEKEIDRQNKNMNLNANDGNIYTLTINKVDKNCKGTYSVKAYNDIGADTCGCVLYVAAIPEIVEKPGDVIVREGETAEFKIKWQAYPVATNTWILDNEEIHAHSSMIEIVNNEEEQSSILRIKKCLIENNNIRVITARIANEIGSVDMPKSNLTIQCKQSW